MGPAAAFTGEPQSFGIDSAKLSGKPSNYSVTPVSASNNLLIIAPTVALRRFCWFDLSSPAGRARTPHQAAFCVNEAAAGLADAAKK
jgi:hypothetical protein